MGIIVIAHNIRSLYNVGAIFRSCDGFGVEKLYLTGYTPYPSQKIENRLPHITAKLDHAIHKTALGAEKTVKSEHVLDVVQLINGLKDEGYQIIALEQAPDSIMLDKIPHFKKVALVLGEEINGISDELLELSDLTAEIPMKGRKESFNVSVACGIALYALSVVRK